MDRSCPEICLMLTWASWRFLRQTMSQICYRVRPSGICRAHRSCLSSTASHSILRLHLAMG